MFLEFFSDYIFMIIVWLCYLESVLLILSIFSVASWENWFLNGSELWTNSDLRTGDLD